MQPQNWAADSQSGEITIVCSNPAFGDLRGIPIFDFGLSHIAAVPRLFFIHNFNLRAVEDVGEGLSRTLLPVILDGRPVMAIYLP